MTGRPLKAHAPGTEVTVSVLMPAELKTTLQHKAVKAKRTLSAEAQLRLEKSVERSDHGTVLYDGVLVGFGELGGLMLMVTHAMDRAGRLAAWEATDDPAMWVGDTWLTNPCGFEAAVDAAHTVLKIFRPEGKVKPSSTSATLATEMVQNFLLGPLEDTTSYAAEIRKLFTEPTLERIRRQK